MAYNFHQLREIWFERVKGVKVVFEMESPISNSDQIVTTQQPLLPYLEHLKIVEMEKLSHVWKCNNWNKFFILYKHHPQSSFQNLTSVHLEDCPSMKYLFSPLMLKLLSNLKEVTIIDCDGMEEVVSNRDDNKELTSSSYAQTVATLFPHLHLLQLCGMKNLKHIDGQSRTTTDDVSHGQSMVSQVDVVSWSLCQYTREIRIFECDALSSVIPSYAAGQTLKLQEPSISGCASMMEVFESKEITSNNISGCSSNTIVAIPRSTYSTVHKLPHLKILYISFCNCLENIFTFSILESLKKLEELTISKCDAMKVIVREEVQEDTTTLSKNVVFTSLKSIDLYGLPNLTGFFLGMNIDFEWPLLEYVKIKDCPQMTVFTSGLSTTPRLKYINTGLGQHNLECSLNFHQTPSTSLDYKSSNPTISEGITWSFYNLIQCNLDSFHEDTKIFPSSELQKLEKLETIHAQYCKSVEEVFEVASEVTNNESQTGVKIPKLREVDLKGLTSLKYIWKSNQWRKLEFPNLTRLSINECDSLEYVFTCSMVGCIKQLQELHIQRCKKMKGVVKGEKDCGDKVSEIIEFPRLKSLNLDDLKSLEGFSLGKEDFTFPSLDTLQITVCPEIMVFTEGRSIIPEQTVVETSFGSFNIGDDISSFVMTKKQE
ncbi:hypothetical protein M8C21_002693, partial [Ambrosia artemisiifolia]